MKYASPLAGFTILEILVVIAILGILVAISIINYNQFRRPEREAAQIIYGSLARLRAEAMSNTDSRRLILLSTGVLSQQRALSCGSTEDTWTSLGDVNFSDVTRGAVPPPFTLSQTPISGVVDPTLPAGAKLVACFTPRGQAAIPTGLPTGQINVVGKRAVRVEVALGGGMKINGYNP